jgi:hypothetical protein
MWRLLSWIANIVSIAWGGSIALEPGDSGLALAQADDSAPRWAARAATLAPLVVVLLILINVPWPIVAVVAAILLLPLVLNRIRVLGRS